MHIHLTAIIKSKTENIQQVKSLLQSLVPKSKQEPACLQYDLHQALEEPAVFIFNELWESKEGLDKHNEEPYLRQFVKDIQPLITEQIVIYKTQLLPDLK